MVASGEAEKGGIIMKKWSVRACLVTVLVAGFCLWEGAGATPLSKPQSKNRIGTFRRAELLVAFYHSAIWDKELQSLKNQLEKAKAEGDQKRVQEVESQGSALQERAHKQLTGEAPLTNILPYLQSAWKKVAKEAGVSVIIEQPVFYDESVELIDVTTLLVKEFPPVNKIAKSGG
jgi:hypothetical protein